MFANPPPQQIEALLRSARIIAVVGLSADPGRPSHRVARALQGFGYRIIPVNPTLSEALGEKAYPRLDAVPDAVDTALIFLRAEEDRKSVV